MGYVCHYQRVTMERNEQSVENTENRGCFFGTYILENIGFKPWDVIVWDSMGFWGNRGKTSWQNNTKQLCTCWGNCFFQTNLFVEQMPGETG